MTKAKKKPPTKTKTTKPNLEETVEAPPEPSATQKLDTAIRAKAHSLVQAAIADLWRFVEKPNKDEFDPEVLEWLAGREILKPPSLLEGALVGQMLNGLVIRSKVRIKPAEMPRTPTATATATVNSATGFASHATEQSKPYDAHQMAERLLEATTGRKK